MIEDLTPEQEELLEQYSERYKNIFNNCDQANWESAEWAIEQFYLNVNKPKPKFINVESPLAAYVAITIFDKTINPKFIPSKTPSKYNGEFPKIKNNFMLSLNKFFDRYPEYPTKGKNQILNELNNVIQNKLQIKKDNGNFLGFVDSKWIMFYKFCIEVLGVEYEKKASELLDMWFQTSKYIFSWHPFEEYCFLCNKPKSIIHSDIGSIELTFRDGYEISTFLNETKPA